MEMTVKLQVFEGPLDLLLHLLEKNKVNIYDIPITEYAPLKIKMAITGNGQASKEQVADMLQRMLHFPKEEMPTFMDATDGLAAAYCHFLQMGRPAMEKGYSSWKDFIAKNPDKVK